MRRIVFIDVETTGLCVGFHEIIEIAAVEVEPRGLTITREWVRKVKPLRLEDAHPRALEKNGYTPAGWEDAVDLAVALQELTPILRGALVGGHNVGFDAAFLLSAYQSFGYWCPMGLGSYHKIDTVPLAWPLMDAGRVTRLTLDEVCAALEIEGAGSHSALPDARCSLEIFKWNREVHRAGLRAA